MINKTNGENKLMNFNKISSDSFTSALKQSLQVKSDEKIKEIKDSLLNKEHTENES